MANGVDVYVAAWPGPRIEPDYRQIQRGSRTKDLSGYEQRDEYNFKMLFWFMYLSRLCPSKRFLLYWSTSYWCTTKAYASVNEQRLGEKV